MKVHPKSKHKEKHKTGFLSDNNAIAKPVAAVNF